VEEVVRERETSRAVIASHPQEGDPLDYSHRLLMPLGEAIFTQRSIRRFRPEPVSLADVHLILEAAVRAPNGGNQQIAGSLS
jgi:Nitroreductase family